MKLRTRDRGGTIQATMRYLPSIIDVMIRALATFDSISGELKLRMVRAPHTT